MSEVSESTVSESIVKDDLTWHKHHVARGDREQQKNQKSCLLWFTGLSGAGKSTVANALESALFERGQHTYLLDGDNVRHGLNKDLGFSDADRVENIRRIGEVAKLFVDAGLMVFSAFISPFRADRRLVRDLFPEGEFVEVFVSTPLSECEARDPKGLYKKARKGEIKHFTGIDSEYQEPESAELVVDTSRESLEESVERIIAYLEQGGYLS